MVKKTSPPRPLKRGQDTKDNNDIYAASPRIKKTTGDLLNAVESNEEQKPDLQKEKETIQLQWKAFHKDATGSGRTPQLVYTLPQMDRGDPGPKNQYDENKTMYSYSWMGTSQGNKNKFAPAQTRKNQEALESQPHYRGTFLTLARSLATTLISNNLFSKRPKF